MPINAAIIDFAKRQKLSVEAISELAELIDASERKQTAPPKRKSSLPSVSERASAGFDRFWDVMPKRSGGNPKDKAKTSFCRAVDLEGVDPEEIIASAAAASRYYAHVDKRSLIPQAVTWLNQRRWLDDYSEPIRSERRQSASSMLRDHINDQQRSAIRDGALFLM